MPHIKISVESIPIGIPVRVEHGSASAVVIRTVESVSAFEDSCPHAQWRLSGGEVSGNVLECPGHGWEFNVLTGRCLNVPAYRLRPYKVTLSNQTVHIEWDEGIVAPYDEMTSCSKICARGSTG